MQPDLVLRWSAGLLSSESLRIFFAAETVSTGRTACVYAAFSPAAASDSFLRSAYTHQVLRCTAGTFASSADRSVSGTGFSNALIKYLAPILYDAERSQLYRFPF